MIPANDSWHSGRNTTSTLSSMYCFSTCSIASASPFAVMSFRISLSSLSSSAISPARSGSSAKSIRSATFALFNRPPAFKQGPITKPIWYALKFSISRLFFSISFRSPVFFVDPIFLRPYFTISRFSSWSFMTSPTVAMAANSNRSIHSLSGIPSFSYSTRMSFQATTAPQISWNG